MALSDHQFMANCTFWFSYYLKTDNNKTSIVVCFSSLQCTFKIVMTILVLIQ